MANKSIVPIAVFFFTMLSSWAQNPFTNSFEAKGIRYSTTQPVVSYTLTIDIADLSGYKVEMKVRNAGDTFRIAMVTHPEYDDRFWRFVTDLKVTTPNSLETVSRLDSAVWRVTAPGGTASISYFIKLPAAESFRAAWRPFLSPTGGLTGGIHSFLYVVGSTLAPSYVKLQLPKGWTTATGLESTSDPSIFFAPSVAILTDSPILVGIFKAWHFSVDDVPHRVVYWPASSTARFDTTRLVNLTRQFVIQAKDLFGRLPYREYSFILQDAAYGGLEHLNSVVLGMAADHLATDMTDNFGGIAHEYFHTWNLMRIHPVEYGDVSYLTPQLTRALWWSEGMTMFYADLLSRRAKIPMSDSTRVQHLQRLIRSYYNTPGNSKISPEKVSLAEYGPRGMLGDYVGSTHLQGELLGTMMDLIIREKTRGKNDIDEVMRKMLVKFSGEKGFTGRDIEQLVSDRCGCDMNPFFEKYVRGSTPIDFNSFLQSIGLKYSVTWEDGLNDQGKPVEDLRIFADQADGDKKVVLRIFDPENSWGKAGLHTGDEIKTVNGKLIHSVAEFRTAIRTSHIGDRLKLVVTRSNKEVKITVVIAVYRRPVVRIDKIPDALPQQLDALRIWLAGEALH